MLDITLLRKDAAGTAARLAARGFDFDLAAFEALEAERKAVQTRTEDLQARRNALSKQIGALKSKGEDASAVMAEVGAIPRADQVVRGAARQHPGAPAGAAARRAQPAARLGAGRRLERGQRRSAPLGNAAQLRFRRQGSRRRRRAAGARLRDRGQARRRALLAHARPGRPPASRARAVHARRADAGARLHRVLHAVHRQRRDADRHRPAAEVRAGPVLR